MNRNDYIIESFILGFSIYFGLSLVDIQVTVNVTDKPIISTVGSGDDIRNIDLSGE